MINYNNQLKKLEAVLKQAKANLEAEKILKYLYYWCSSHHESQPDELVREWSHSQLVYLILQKMLI